MGKILIVKGVDFSENALTKVIPSDILTWDVKAPLTPFTGDEFQSDAQERYCFSDASQVFNGTKEYSVVEIIMRGKENIDNLNVYLLEVEGYTIEPSDPQMVYPVSMLGTINLVQDKDTIAQFALPSLDATKKYIVGVFTKAKKFFLKRTGEEVTTSYTIIATSGYQNFQTEAYKDGVGRGRYIYSYYQIKYK